MKLPRGREQTLGLIDQAVMSGAMFGAVVILARWSGVFELGLYTLGMSGIVLLINVEESIVTAPYAIYSNLRRLEGQALALATGSAFLQTAVLGASAAAVVLASAALLPGGLGEIALPLAFAILATLLREFARRQCLALGRLRLLLTLDGLAAGVQLGLLVWLGLAGRLTAALALAALGFSALIGFAVWWLANRGSLRFARSALEASTSLAWSFGRWILLCSVASVFGGYSIHWILASAVGAAATGAFEMVRSLANLFNPVTMGLRNVLGPMSARIVAERGEAGLTGLIRSSLVSFVLLGAGWLTVLGIAGDVLLEVLYGTSTDGLAGALLIVGAANVIVGLGIPADQALWALESPKINAIAALLAVPIIAGLTIALLPHGPVLAGATGFAIGRTVETGVRYAGLAWRLRSGREALG